MTDLEISKALALAIGWKENDDDPDVQTVVPSHLCEDVYLEVWFENNWCPFDYRDWNVIGPIAERYDCFPYKTYYGKWTAWGGDCSDCSEYKTPQKAIALAVIKGAKK
jgi:hypothetical protein